LPRGLWTPATHCGPAPGIQAQIEAIGPRSEWHLGAPLMLRPPAGHVYADWRTSVIEKNWMPFVHKVAKFFGFSGFSGFSESRF
jgi:hypothetical protein